MNIVFWGGCINRQQNLAAEKHYHFIVQSYLGRATGITPGIALQFYSSYHELKREAQLLLQSDKYFDYCVVFIRPFALIPLTKLLVRYKDKNLQNRLVLHPRFSKSAYYDHMIEEYKINETGTGNSFLHNVVKRANNFVGDELNLPQWACAEVLGILKEIYAMTRQRKTRFLLAGPLLYPGDNRVNKICMELNNDIALFSAAHNIPHIDIARLSIEGGGCFLEEDNKHLSEAGHEYLAQQILKCLPLPQPSPADDSAVIG